MVLWHLPIIPNNCSLIFKCGKRCRFVTRWCHSGFCPCVGAKAADPTCLQRCLSYSPLDLDLSAEKPPKFITRSVLTGFFGRGFGEDGAGGTWMQVFSVLIRGAHTPLTAKRRNNLNQLKMSGTSVCISWGIPSMLLCHTTARPGLLSPPAVGLTHFTFQFCLKDKQTTISIPNLSGFLQSRPLRGGNTAEP